MKTNSKEFTAIITDYILNAIDSEAYEVVTTTPQEKLQFLADTFSSEYLYAQNLQRYGNVQEVLKNWIMGLPSAFNIDFENYRILEIAREWGSIDVYATEREEDKIISNWFNFISFKTLQLMTKHNIQPIVKN